MDEEPSMARFSGVWRPLVDLIRFDPGGIGLSDRGSP
jgi:hypothetical protein